MIFRKTRVGDIDRVLEILAEGRAAIAKLGIDQWQDGYPGRDIIEKDVERGISYVIDYKRSLEGTVVMMTGGEPDYNKIYEGDWITSCYVPYLTIHRIALSDKLRGTGAATYILARALQMAKNCSCVSIRVDTHEGNVAMRRMLEKHNFVYCGVIYLGGVMDEKHKRVGYELIV